MEGFIMANLELEYINSSDYVSPDPINRNFEKLDGLGVDYITEQGTSGEWWYRKWNSGRMECGIDDKEFPNVSHTTAWGPMYRSEPLNFGTFPFAFISRPWAVVSYNSNSGPLQTAFPIIQANSSVTKAPSFYLIAVSSGTMSKPHFGILAVGKYK